MSLHSEIYNKVARHAMWRLTRLPHESNGNHLGYGDTHINLLAIHKPDNILVVGSQYGFIPAIIGMTAKSYGGKVDFVDANYDETIQGRSAYSGRGYWTKDNISSFLETFALKDTLRFHIKTTKEFFNANHNRYQYAYLDGDHSYEGIRYDFEQAKLCCDSGSFITLHDAKMEDWRGWSFGIKRFLTTLADPYIIIGNSPGLAIVSV